MPLSLREVLEHPSLVRADPVLLSGTEHTSQVVRWVHSSEVLDIAPLLRGGELLLTGGMMLVDADAECQRAYIRALATHGITAVAMETVAGRASLPEALVDEAKRQEFVLIQLNRTVPFVEITESVNGQLVNDSVQRLRIADSLSDALSTQLASGADLQHLVETLAVNTSAGVVVRDRSGETLAADTATLDTEIPSHARRAPITVYGVTTAALELLPTAETRPHVLEAALDRAPQAFSLALLRTRPPTPDTRAARTLFNALRGPAPAGTELASLIEAAGLDSAAPFVAVAATRAEAAFYGALEQAMRRGGRCVLSHADDEFLAVATVARPREKLSRQALVHDVRQVSELATERPTIGVGPLAHDSRHLAHTVSEARRCLDIDLRPAAHDGVIDAENCSLQRLAHQLDADTVLAGFVQERLGTVLHQQPQTRERLLSTLETFFDCAMSKTKTAERLHLRRQTLYQRLDALTRCLGHEVTHPASLPELQVAVRLLRVLERRPGSSGAAPGTPRSVPPP